MNMARNIEWRRLRAEPVSWYPPYKLAIHHDGVPPGFFVSVLGELIPEPEVRLYYENVAKHAAMRSKEST